jgi:hypothetical protein
LLRVSEPFEAIGEEVPEGLPEQTFEEICSNSHRTLRGGALNAHEVRQLAQEIVPKQLKQIARLIAIHKQRRYNETPEQGKAA